MDNDTRRKLADLELSVRVLSKVLMDADLITERDIREAEQQIKQEAAQQALDGGTQPSNVNYEPTQSSEVVEYSDGTVEKSGEKFE